MHGLLTPERVVPRLRGRFGVPYVYAPECPSTQRLLPGDAPEGAVAVCELQTAGRGRFDRRWEAPRGTAILCSTLLRPPERSAIPQLSLVAGLAVARAVETATGLTAGVKWPNDVLLAGRKTAGVLAEWRSGGVVLGIGLNVNQTEAELPDTGALPAGSLRTADGALRDRAPLLAGLLGELERAYDTWLERGLAPLLPELADRDVLRGQPVAVDGVRGTAGGIAPGGELVVTTDAGRRLVASGEVLVAASR